MSSALINVLRAFVLHEQRRLSICYSTGVRVLAPKSRSPLSRHAVGAYGLSGQPVDRAPVLEDDSRPRALAHLRKVDAAEEEAHDEMNQAVVERLIADSIERLLVSFGAVGGGPGTFKLLLRLRYGHLQGRVRHLIGRELQPVLRSRQTPAGLQTLVERRRGEGRELAEDGQARRPRLDLAERALGYARRVVVQADDERGDRVDVAPGEAVEHCGVLRRLVEALVHVGEVGRVNRLHADENPLAVGGGDQVHQLLVAQEVGADLRDPGELRPGGDDVSQERLRALDVDGEVVVYEKDHHLIPVRACVPLEPQHLFDDRLVRAEAYGVAEETRDSAELAAVWAAAARLDGDQPHRAPARAVTLQERPRELRHQVELLK